MSDTVISRLANCRAMAARRLPAPDIEAIDLGIAEIAELQDAYALLFRDNALLRQVHADYRRECGDTDAILRVLGLDPVNCRTDGGSLKLVMIPGALEHRDLMLKREATQALRGERDVLVRLLVEADKVLSTIEGECQEEWDMLSDLRRAIAAATIPHRPDEAGLLAIRAALCPHQHAIDDWRNSGA